MNGMTGQHCRKGLWDKGRNMTNLLYKLFIKDYIKTKDPAVRERYGKLAGLVGILTNLSICLLKIGIGLVQNSIAIIADGINNLSDAASSVITLVGFKLAAMPEDEGHPYGHARIEYLTGMIVSMIIVFVGFQLVLASVDKILHPEPMEFNGITVGILVFSILVKLWQSRFYRTTSRTIHSVALKASSADSRNDVLATSVVLVSLAIGHFSGFQVDGIMGCVVALFIIWSGIALLRETSNPLLGESPDEDLVHSIKEAALSYGGVLGIHDLVVHNYGPGKIFASIHIEVDAKSDIMVSHDLVDNIERELSEKLHIHLVAHMDPVLINDPATEKLNRDIENAIADLDGVESIHDLRIVPGPTHTNIIFDVVLSPVCQTREGEITKIIEGAVKKIDPTYFVVITFDKSYLSFQ